MRTNLEGSGEFGAQTVEQCGLTLEIKHAHTANMPGEVTFCDKLGQHRLLDGRGMAVDRTLFARVKPSTSWGGTTR